MNAMHILWVDDEIDLLKPQLLFLESKGYEVIGLTNGRDAIDYLETNNINMYNELKRLRERK